MAIANVQRGTGATSTGTGTVSPSWPGATTSGNLLVCLAASRATGANVPVIDTPSGWTQAIQDGATSNQKAPRVAIFYKQNAASESGSVAVSLVSDTTSDMYAVLAEYSGVATSSALDQTATAESDAATTTGDTGTTGTIAQANELVIALIAHTQNNTASAQTNSGTVTYSTALTERDEQRSGNATAANKVNGVFTDGITNATGTVRVTETISSSGRPMAGVVATFKEASASQSKDITAATETDTAVALSVPRLTAATETDTAQAVTYSQAQSMRLLASLGVGI